MKTCPATTEIDAFLSRSLPDEFESPLFKHIEQCPACMAYVESHSPGLDSFITRPGILSDGSADSRDATSADTDPALFPLGPARNGDLLAGFQVVRLIGRGGMGEVYECMQPALARRVAVKILRAGKETPTARERIDREALIQSRLQHPNIAAVYEYHLDDARPFIVMELVPGQPLGRFLKERPMRPKAVARLAASLARTVQFAHDQGVIHRDLKPSNVIVSTAANLLQSGVADTAQTTFKLIDFGIARLADAETDLTRTGGMVGSPAYLAPEQTRNPLPKAAPGLDIYGLGVILYECLTGRPPFMAGDVSLLIDLIRREVPVSPRELVRDLPRDLETICLKCLEKSPAKRYPTALAVAEDLERYLNGFPIHARPLGPVGHSWRWCRRNRVAVAGLVALMAIVLLGAGLALTQQARVFAQQELKWAETNNRNLKELTDSAESALRQARNYAELMTGMVRGIGREGRPAAEGMPEFLGATMSALIADDTSPPAARTTLLSEIGAAWLRIGNPGQSEIAYRKVMEIQKAEVGPTHELVIETGLKLARAIEGQGKSTEAVALLEPFFESLQRSGRLESMLGKYYRSRLARAFIDSNQPEKAIALLERLLDEKSGVAPGVVPLKQIQNDLAEARDRKEHPEKPSRLKPLAPLPLPTDPQQRSPLAIKQRMDQALALGKNNRAEALRLLKLNEEIIRTFHPPTSPIHRPMMEDLAKTYEAIGEPAEKERVLSGISAM